MRKLKDKEEQYNIFLKYSEAEKKESDNLNVIIIVLSAIVLSIAIICGLLYIKNDDTGLADKIHKFLQSNRPSEKIMVAKTMSFPFKSKRQTILLLGVDSNGPGADPFKGTRSDTIILLNIDASDRSINAISIPRDSKVYLAGDEGVQKINAAHAIGGIEVTKKTIEDTLGVQIDNYIIVNNDAVIKLIDTIGGVPVYIEKDMSYHDYSAGLHINLKKGIRILDGKESEGYLRYRKDGLGDIGRTSRQQWFMKALVEKLQTPEAIAKVPEALKIANKYVKTDLSLYQLSQYAVLARSININSIEVATLPGSPNKKGYISYWILDPEKTQEVVDRMVYRKQPSYDDRKLIAGIMYSVDKENEAMKIKEQLRTNGYEVSCIGRGNLPHSQIIGHNSAVTPDFVAWLKKKVPEVRNTQFVYDPVRTYCVKSDFTIIVSGS